MSLLAESARRALIGNARNEIGEAAGTNALLSRAEQRTLAPDLQRAADAARDAKGHGARISVNDAVDAYAGAVTQTLKDVNQRGAKWLSKEEIADVADPELQGRLWDIRAAHLKPASLTRTGLLAKAASFVIDNADGGPQASRHPNAPFPIIDAGNMGLQVGLLEGEAAEFIAKIGAALFPDGNALESFDPDKQAIIGAWATWDEPHIHLAIIDRRTGQATYVDDANLVDMTFMMEASELDAIFGKPSDFEPGAESWDDVYELDQVVIDRMLGKSTPLDVGGEEMHLELFAPNEARTLLERKFPALDIDAMMADANALFDTERKGRPTERPPHMGELKRNNDGTWDLELTGTYVGPDGTDYVFLRAQISGSRATVENRF